MALPDGGAIGREVTGHGALEDPEIVQRNFRKRLRWNAEILGQHLGRCMREPVRHQQCIEFVGMTVIEADHELTTVRTKPLQRMRRAGRKVPDIALLHVGNIGPALRIENGDATIAVGHDRPLGCLMPVQLTDSTGGQPHVDPGYLRRNCKVIHRDLARPAAVLNALR